MIGPLNSKSQRILNWKQQSDRNCNVKVTWPQQTGACHMLPLLFYSAEFCAAELMVYLPVVYIIYYLKLSWRQDSLKSSLAISHVRCLKKTDISMTISVLIIRDVTHLVYVMFHYITCIRWKGLCVCRFTSGKEIKMCLSESVLNCC